MWAELRFVNVEPGGTHRHHKAFFIKFIFSKNVSTHGQSVQILATFFFFLEMFSAPINI